MFSSTLAQEDSLATYLELDEERDPPDPPTPLTWPDYSDMESVRHAEWSRNERPNLKKIFWRLKYNDVKPSIFHQLNVKASPSVNVYEFLESTGDAVSHLPPESWFSKPETPEQENEVPQENGVPRKLHNGKNYPSRFDFYHRIIDFHMTNEDGFHALTRRTLDGKPPPPIRYGRPFFSNLDQIVQYWDSSQDVYIPPADWTDSSPPPIDKCTYRGYRIGNGAQMSERSRITCIERLVEVAAWPFGFVLQSIGDVRSHLPTRLDIPGLRLGVPLCHLLLRSPASYQRGRQGFREGPVLGISCRKEAKFNSGNRAIVDVLGELGAGLLIAQMRNREGRPQARLGEGKWWFDKPRWAGREYEVPGEFKPEEGKPRQKRTNHQNQIEDYKIGTPGRPVWDPKMEYLKIGKEEGSEWDQAFLISSVNHHVSLVKLDVHAAYTDYILTGSFPDPAPADPAWCCPRHSRSRWYDVLSPRDRVEFLHGLWALMGYLARTPAAAEGVAAGAAEGAAGGERAVEGASER